MGSANKHDFSYGIDVDASENIYITGGFEETVDFDPSASTASLTSASVSAQDIYVAKYDSSGAYQWAFQAGGATVVDDHAFDIDVTPAGDVYICGEVWGPADFDPSTGSATISTSNDQIFFARYDNSGNFVWVFEVGATGSNGSADNGFGVHAAGTGTVYVTGDFNGTADFDPSAGSATLTSSGGDAFVAAYGASVFIGVNETKLSDSSVKVFPVPSDGMINFSYAGFDTNEWSIEITDLTGKTILIAENIKEETVMLNSKDLESGIYFYNIRTKTGTLTKKFIVQ
jgi:hypothetical protein